jgi:hypothetical protein
MDESYVFQAYGLGCIHFVAYYNIFKIKNFHEEMPTFCNIQMTFYIWHLSCRSENKTL